MKLYNKCPFLNNEKQQDKIREEHEEQREAASNWKYNKTIENKAKWGSEIIDNIQALYTLLINNFGKKEIIILLKKHFKKMKKRHQKIS
jgi:hypothetical protein